MATGIEVDCATGEVRTVEVPEPGATVPASVSMRQARLALLGAGLLSQVEAAITDEAARIEWEYAATVERGNALMAAIGTGLGLTDEAIDALFVTAAAL